ncbi:hypothetical protein C8N40_101644 [Pontibacter mucosus]|uniref:Uncharacterized protein n=1 Tax=Pontibacter mucosus TaxID=1649266 RepID=A0A2T5YU37_9BACT|nr:YtxH domain-containing protein [Pontibacter mucosus]PTX22816.1 hypothetical protein C8N40_101644 [Pontibacter mucosus]
MKKSIVMFLALGMFAFASCDSSTENAAERDAERVEDSAEEMGNDIEDAADEAGDEIEEGAEKVENEVQ